MRYFANSLRIYLFSAVGVLVVAGCGGNPDAPGGTTSINPLSVSHRLTTTSSPTALICDCGSQNYDVNQDITLTGACSHSDTNHSIVKYEWDFGYNGTTFNTQATGETVTKVGGYAIHGNYAVALRVEDDAQQTDVNVCTVSVTPPPHCPHPDAGGDFTHTYNGFVGVPVHFDAGGSFDPDQDPLTYSWSLSGNVGVFGDSTLATPTYTYNSLGTYSVAVQVTDHPDQNQNPSTDAPCIRTAFATVVIGDHRPSANPGGPYQCVPNQTIMLDGSGSFDQDPGDAITAYAWDLDNDGNFGDSTVVRPSFTCGAAVGTVYSVCIRVTDTAGAKDTKCTTVSITSPPPTCVAGMPTTMECNGRGVAFQLDGSASSDPLGRPLTFTWSASTCDSGSVSFSNASAAKTAASFNTGSLNACVDRCVVTLTCDNGTARSTSSTTLLVQDTTPPSISCPAAVTAECSGNMSAPVAPGGATASDSCSAVTVQNVPAGSFPLGKTTTTYAATDACGNSSSCQSSVTVVDTTPPVITCPSEVTAECTGNESAPVTPKAASASDVCGSVNVVSPTAGTYPLGTTSVTYSATDQAGLVSSCNTTIKVQDTTPPSISCPAAKVAECSANGSAQVAPDPASASDSCSPVTVTNPPAASYPLGTTTVGYTATDTSGNTSSCSATITVMDTTPPVFDQSSLGDRTVIGNCTAGPVRFELPTATDACTHAVVDCESVPGNIFGDHPVTCHATDAAGNVSSATLTVRVLQPLHVTFLPPLADDNVADDVASDADVSNLFRPGQVIPHIAKLYDCQGVDVTASALVTMKLTVSRGAAGSGTDLVNDVDDFAGAGDVDGRMILIGNTYRYNLKTNSVDYPSGGQVFQSLVTASYTSAPALVAGAEDARLVSR